MGNSHESSALPETLLEREEQARPTSSHPARAACAPRQTQSLLDHFPILHQPATQNFTTQTCPSPTHSPSTRPTEALAEPSAQSAARSPHQPQLPATQHTTKDCPQFPGPSKPPNQRDNLSALYTASHARYTPPPRTAHEETRPFPHARSSSSPQPGTPSPLPHRNRQRAAPRTGERRVEPHWARRSNGWRRHRHTREANPPRYDWWRPIDGGAHAVRNGSAFNDGHPNDGPNAT